MYPRHASTQLEEALADTPVVLVHGPRQAGKSTLVRRIATARSMPYVTLDDVLALAAASSDPDGFLRQFDGPVAIDEVQRVPDLFRAIKAAVDRDRQPGRFLLTGSANVLMLPRLSDSLVGRMEVQRLWPLAQAELAGGRANFVDQVLAGTPPLVAGRLGRRELLGLALTGGFPEAVARASARRRAAWFANYMTTVVQRDLRELADVEQLTEVPRLLQALAARSAGLLNVAGLSRDTGLTQRTLGRYLALLRALFLVEELPAWFRNVGKRLAKAPKVLLTDTGLMAHLLSIDSVAQAERDAGALLETLVAMELRKQADWSEARAELFHYRTLPGREVDLVLQRGNGELVGIEVKCASTVSSSDFAGLRDLAEAAGELFVAGLVLHSGPTAVRFGERLWALPVESLWTA